MMSVNSHNFSTINTNLGLGLELRRKLKSVEAPLQEQYIKLVHILLHAALRGRLYHEVKSGYKDIVKLLHFWR